MGTEDQLAWDEFRVDDVLATMEATPQQADELAASQFTQPPPVLTQSSQLGTGGATTGGGATPTGVGAAPASGGATPAGVGAPPAGGGVTWAGVGASPAGGGATPAGRATPDAAGSSQAAMATPSPDQLAPRVVRPPDPWTYDQDHTWACARAVRGEEGPTHLDLVLLFCINYSVCDYAYSLVTIPSSMITIFPSDYACN
jgi:hypothetical protein